MSRVEVYTHIDTERERQELLHEHTCASPLMSDAWKLAVLMEEVGEVARALLEGKPEDMATELVQVAACCVAWLEGTL